MALNVAQMDFICSMYAKDHPEEYVITNTSESRKKVSIIEEQKAWWDTIKHRETRRKMIYNDKRPVIPSQYQAGKVPSGMVIGSDGKPVDLTVDKDPFAKLREGR